MALYDKNNINNICVVRRKLRLSRLVKYNILLFYCVYYRRILRRVVTEARTENMTIRYILWYEYNIYMYNRFEHTMDFKRFGSKVYYVMT